MFKVAVGLVMSLGLGALSAAQSADVQFKGDLTLSFLSQSKTSPNVVSYHPLGRYSLFGLKILTEPGFTATLTQRVQHFENDADPDSFDEAYLEDEGIWRIGKQYLPFGAKTLFRETAVAIRGDNDLLLEGIPIAVAFVGNGTGRQSGVVGRLGRPEFGFSVAIGRHFGINGTALTPIRRVSDSPGRGRGWREAYAVDGRWRAGNFGGRFEGLVLREPESSLDEELSIIDLQSDFDLDRKATVSIGFTRVFESTDFITRVSFLYRLSRGFTLEGMVRENNGRFVDLSFGIRVKF